MRLPVANWQLYRCSANKIFSTRHLRRRRQLWPQRAHGVRFPRLQVLSSPALRSSPLTLSRLRFFLLVIDCNVFYERSVNVTNELRTMFVFFFFFGWDETRWICRFDSPTRLRYLPYVLWHLRSLTEQPTIRSLSMEKQSLKSLHVRHLFKFQTSALFDKKRCNTGIYCS